MTRRYLTAVAYTCMTIVFGVLTGIALVGLARLAETFR